MKKKLHQLLFLLCISVFSTNLLYAQDNALNFDGNGDFVDCGNILPASYTKEAWIYITDLSKVNNIMSGDDNYKHVFWAYPGPTNLLSAGHIAVNEVIDVTPLLANTWYHVAVTYDATTNIMRLYKNGVMVSQNTTVINIPSPAKLYIGNYTNNNYVFAGNMDNIRIWSVARTASEIAQFKNVTFITAQPNLVANYTCNQGLVGGDNSVDNNNMRTKLIDVPNNTNPGILIGFTLSGNTSNFVISNLVLPVELLSFKAISGVTTPKGASAAVELIWATALEMNNKGFQVERLNPATNGWEILGFVIAQGKAATYHFYDEHPLSMSYYRLHQMDKDGKETFSNVVSAATKSTGKLHIYPNPASDVLILDLDAQSDFQIFNLLGQEIQHGRTAQRIDVSALPKGTYVIKVGTEKAKFMKL